MSGASKNDKVYVVDSGSTCVKCYKNILIREHFHLCGVNDEHVFTIQRFIAN
jgi:hypothetical protein